MDKNKDADILQPNSAGGLNTISSSLNIPLEDSPDLGNIEITAKGNVAKRRGTQFKLRKSGLTNPEGTTLVPVTLKSYRRLIVSKESTSLVLYDVTDSSYATLMTKSNVWTTAAASVKASYAVTNEVTPRIIFTTGINCPVQVNLVETLGYTLSSSNTISISDTRYQYATTANVVVWVGGVKQTVSNVSYSSGTCTITLSASTSGTANILFVTWQWWAEAIKLNGDQVYYAGIRFNVDKQDRNVEIPTDLIYNITEDYTLAWDASSSNFGRYPINIYQTTDPSSIYTWKSDRKPTTTTQFVFSNGGFYDNASTKEVVPGYTYVTFGNIAASPPQDPQELHFVRLYGLPFNGGTGIAGNNLIVKVDNTTWTQNTSATPSGTFTTSPTYHLYNTSYGLVTSGSTAGYFLSFTSNTIVGCPTSATIRIINKTAPSSYIGSGATSGIDSLRDGYGHPAYGIYQFADYSRGSFPRNVGIHQGRLCLAGFPLAPMQVVFSNVYDSTIAGEYFNNFQTVLEPLSSSNAVDITLGGQLDEIITALTDYKDSMFVFTRKSMFRIKGGDAGISVGSIFANYIAGIGCVNPHSLCKVDKTVLFLAPSGVYDITPTLEAGDYSAGERSLKIRNLLDSSNTPYNEATSWMFYDPTREEVWLSVSDSTQLYLSSKLFIYSTLRNSWTRYSRTNGVFYTYHGAVSQSTANDSYVILASSDYSTYPNSPTTLDLIECNKELPLDYVSRVTSPTNGALTYTTFYKVSHTTNKWQHRYATSPQSTLSSRGFYMLPVLDFQDAAVFLDGLELTFGTEWVKISSEEIYVNKVLQDGQTLVIEQRDDKGHHPIALILDNVLLTQGIDYTISEDADRYSVSFTAAPAANSILVYGQKYGAYFKTPLFIRESLDKAKRFFHFYGYLNNEAGQEVYRASDANSSSGQSPEQITDLYKYNLNLSVGFLYNDSERGHVSSDLYGSGDLTWDIDLFDITPNSAQHKPYVRLAEPIIGIGYSFQVVFFNFDCSKWELVGYQVTTSREARSSLSWFS